MYVQVSTMKCMPLVFLVLCCISSGRSFRNHDFTGLKKAFGTLTGSTQERKLEDLETSLSRLNDRLNELGHTMDIISDKLNTLHDRSRNLETQVNQQNNKIDNIAYTVDKVQCSLQNWTANLNSIVCNISSRGNAPFVGNETVGALEASLSTRVDKLVSSVERLEEHLLQPTTKAVAAVDTTAIISHIDMQLASLQTAEEEQEWHSMFLGELNRHDHTLTEIKQMTENAMRNVDVLATKEDFIGLFNSTHEHLEMIRYDLIARTGKDFRKVLNQLDDAHASIMSGQDEILESMTDTIDFDEFFYDEVQKNYEHLLEVLEEVIGMAKTENAMTHTADNTLDKKIKNEYGVHQIVLKIGDLIKLHMKDLNMTVNKRFDNISFTILDNQKGGMTNLSSKIDHEISQVLKQIGIMYQQLKASDEIVSDSLKEQMDAYVNDSLHITDNTESKLGQIIGRIGKLYDNFNNQQEWQSQVIQLLGDISTICKNNLDLDQEQVKDMSPDVPSGGTSLYGEDLSKGSFRKSDVYDQM